MFGSLLHDPMFGSLLHDSMFCSLLHDSMFCSLLHDSMFCSLLHDSMFCSLLHDSMFCSLLHDSMFGSLLHDSMFGSLLHDSMFCSLLHDSMFGSLLHDSMFDSLLHVSMFCSLLHDSMFGSLLHDSMFGSLLHDSMFGSLLHDSMFCSLLHDSMFGSLLHDSMFDSLLHVSMFCSLLHDSMFGSLLHDSMFGSLLHDSMFGSLLHDSMFGSLLHDSMFGYLLHDSMFGSLLHDPMFGSLLHDSMFGSLLHDSMFGSLRHDSMFGSLLHDSIFGSLLHVSMFCSLLHDSMFGSLLHDSMFGSLLHDSMFCSLLHDSMFGSLLHDSMFDSLLHVSMFCSLLHDSMFGSLLHDSMFGSLLHDSMFGSLLHDSMFGSLHDSMFSSLLHDSMFGSSLPLVVCRRSHILFMLFVFAWFVFISSCLQEVSYLIYVICVCLVHLYLQLFVGGLMCYFMLFVFVWFVFTSSCLQEVSCLIYVICLCLVRLYLQLFVGGFMSYLRYLCLFGSSLPLFVCRRSHILFMLFVFAWFVFISSCLQEVSYLIYVICVCLVHLYLQLFVGCLMCYFMLFVFVWFVFTSSCLQEVSYLIYVICVCLVRLYLQLFVGGFMSYLRYLCLFGSSLPLFVCRRSHVLFMLFVFVWFVFTSSCLQEVSYLIYVICVCLVHLYLQLFVGGLMSYLRYLCLFGSSLPLFVCRRSHILFMLFVFVWFVFISSCLQEVSYLIYVICVCLVRLYLQLFVGGLISYLRYLCLFGSSLPPIVCMRYHVLFMLFVFVWFVFTSSCLQEVSYLIYVICVCLVHLYLQLFVGGLISYLRYLCLFGSSLPPVVCRRSHVLFMLFVFVWFVFTSSCLQEVSCLTNVICVCLVLLYLQLFVGGLISYLCYLCLFGSSLSLVVCRRAHILFMLFVFVWFIFTSSCLQEVSCLIYVISACLVRLYLQLFVGGLMSYLCYLCLFGSSLPPVVCRRSHVLFMLFLFVWFVFTSSCLQEVSCFIYVICVCLVHLYLQLFVGGLISYLCYLCLFGSSLPLVVWRSHIFFMLFCLFGSSLPLVVCMSSHILFMLFVFVWFVFTSSCLQEVSYLIYVICVCLVHLYLQLFVGGLISYLCYLCLFGSSLPPVVCRRSHIFVMLFVFVWFVFTSSCLVEVSCFIYVICVCLVRLYLQLFVGGIISYLCYLCLVGSSLPPGVCRRSHILFMLFVFVWFIFTSSCLQEVSYLFYVICVCLVLLYLQLFVGGLVSYLCYLCLFGSSLSLVVCRRAHILFMLFVFAWFIFTSSCLQEVSCFIYVICVCLVRLYLQLFVGGLISYLRYLCLLGSSLPPVVCRRCHVLFMLFVFVWFVFISSCLQEISCLIYVICVCLVHLYLQLFVGGLISYLRYLCLFGSSLPPVVCRRSHVLFMLFVFVWFVFISSCLQEVSYLIYVICICLVHLYLQLFVGGLISYLCYLCLFGSSLPPVVCRRSHVLFMLFVFVWFVFISSCLQEVSYLIYVICVCLVHLYLQLFVGGLISYLCYFICLVHLYLQLFVGVLISYLCYLCLFGSSLPPVVCRRSHILFMLFVFVWFVFTSSCLEVSYLIYVICVCLVHLYLQLFVGVLISYLCYLCLFGSSLSPVVCRRTHILFMLFVFVWFIFTSSWLQEVSCLI